jgi:hypothetical protein
VYDVKKKKKNKKKKSKPNLLLRAEAFRKGESDLSAVTDLGLNLPKKRGQMHVNEVVDLKAKSPGEGASAFVTCITAIVTCIGHHYMSLSVTYW